MTRIFSFITCRLTNASTNASARHMFWRDETRGICSYLDYENELRKYSVNLDHLCVEIAFAFSQVPQTLFSPTNRGVIYRMNVAYLVSWLYTSCWVGLGLVTVQ